MNFILAFLFLLPVPPQLPAEDPHAYVKKLEQSYRHAKTLQATFLQQYSEGGKVQRSETGTAYFRRPGKMRWEYEMPEKNLFLVDGKFSWFYVPVDHTVSRVAARESADWRTPLALLAGEMKVSRVCAKVELAASHQPEDTSLVRLNCTLRGAQKESEAGKSREMAYFEIVKATGELARVVVTTSGSVSMEIRFSNWKFDPPIPETAFKFQPPQGVAVVDGDALMPGPSEARR